MNDQEEKDHLKQMVHEQTLREIYSLGATTSLQEANELQRNIARLSEIENERYTRG